MLLSYSLQKSLLESQGVASEMRSAGGYATHLLSAGEGDASLVWFPAVGESAVSFGPALLALVKKLAGVCEVLAIDPPGYGGSELAGAAALPTFGELAPWAGEILTQVARETRPLIVAGNSSGAAIALSGVNRVTAHVRVLGLVFVSWPDWRHGQAPSASELCPVDVAGLHALLARSWHRPPPIPESIAAQLVERLSDPRYRDHVASFDAATYAAELDRYEGPLAFVGGASDRLVPPAVVQASADAHGRSAVRWLTECGHYPHHEARERFVDELADLSLGFLRTSAETPST